MLRSSVVPVLSLRTSFDIYTCYIGVWIPLEEYRTKTGISITMAIGPLFSHPGYSLYNIHIYIQQQCATIRPMVFIKRLHNAVWKTIILTLFKYNNKKLIIGGCTEGERRQRFHRLTAQRFIPEGDKVSRGMIHLPSFIFRRHGSRLGDSSITMTIMSEESKKTWIW